MTPDELPDLIANLADRYGWQLSNTQALLLRDALRSHDRLRISDTAARLDRTLRRPMTPTDLTSALAELATVDLPHHLPSCQCKGTGTLDDVHVGKLPGGHAYRGVGPCPANRGFPITAQQYADWQQAERTRAAANTEPPVDTSRTHPDALARLRALKAETAAALEGGDAA